MTSTPTPTTPSPYSAAFIKEQVERIKAERALVLEEIETDEEQIRELDLHSDESAAFDEVAMALSEKELGRTLVETALITLQNMNHALKNAEAGTYGWDSTNGVWIREERLKALPWAIEEIMNAKVDDSEDLVPPSI